MPPRTPARQSRTDLETTAPGLVKSPRAKKSAGALLYRGASYRLSDKQGVWPLLQFARAAEAGFQVTDPRGLAAIHAFLEDVIHPDDWGRFQEDMISKKVVDLEGLMTAAQKAVSDMLDKLQANGQVKEPETETG